MNDVIRIPMKGGDILLDAVDQHLLEGKSLSIGGKGYPQLSDGTTLHTAIMGGGCYTAPVDHRNGNKRDCRRDNLRRVTCQINQVNRKALNKNNTSGFRGVHATRSKRNPWEARIKVDRKVIVLGRFPTIELAVDARRVAELEHFGELCPTTEVAA